MAGAGYKLFTTGSVLTAADVNTYLNEQTVMVFANAAARTTALASVLAEGMVTYLKDTDALEIYSGTAWVGYGSGDITGVTAGTGLSGGGTSGTVTVSLATPVAATNGGTAQSTYATGDILYASASNTLTKRTIGTTGQVLTVSGGVPTWATPSAGTASYVGVSAYKSAGQSISANTWTAVTFDTEDFDTNSFHDNTTNTSRFTIPAGRAGKYEVSGAISWAASNAGTFRLVAIYKNGSVVNQLVQFAGTNDGTIQPIACVYDLVATDYLEVYVRQNTGGNLDVQGGIQQTRMQLSFLGA